MCRKDISLSNDVKTIHIRSRGIFALICEYHWRNLVHIGEQNKIRLSLVRLKSPHLEANWNREQFMFPKLETTAQRSRQVAEQRLETEPAQAKGS